MFNFFYLHVKKVNFLAKLFPPAYVGDAGYDAVAMDNCTLLPGERYNMPLGVAIEFPSTYVCLVQQKSGLAKKFGFDTIGNVIDSNYRGEIHAQIVNTSNMSISIAAGDKVCQLIFVKIGVAPIEYVLELKSSKRESNGFGSSG